MKKLFLLLILLVPAAALHAQIKYNAAGKLTFGQINLTGGDYVTGWEGRGHYYHYNNTMGGETWLKIFLGAQNVRISGNGGYVVFYGDTFEDIYVKNVFTNSDARAKRNIRTLGNALRLVRQLRPKTYDWASPSAVNAGKSSQHEYGFLAQDLEAVIPEAVASDAEGNKLVNYNTIIPVLAGAIQELESRVETLEARIRELEAAR